MSTTRSIDSEAPASGGEVIVNGQPQAIPARCTVAGLLETLGLGGRRVAVAINREVVPRSTHADAPVRAGDEVEVLEAVGGG